jgi:hypothetical protein
LHKNYDCSGQESRNGKDAAFLFPLIVLMCHLFFGRDVELHQSSDFFLERDFFTLTKTFLLLECVDYPTVLSNNTR